MSIERSLLPQRVRALDHGYVELVDYMGSDQAVIDAARVSYNSSSKKTSSDRDLIRYMMRNYHTSVFEACEVKFYIHCPMIVKNHLIRHRTFNVNEVSARYSVMPDEFYEVEDAHINLQASSNNQGRGDLAPENLRIKFLDSVKSVYKLIYEAYSQAVSDGISKEIARLVLPEGRYTTLMIKSDLHNLLNFMSKRYDKHAQFETQVYAEIIYNFLCGLYPLTMEAFRDYRRGAVMLSKQEYETLCDILNTPLVTDSDHTREYMEDLSVKLSKRELREFKEKFRL